MAITPNEYYEKTEQEPPNKLLVEAVNYVKVRDTALDLGAGTLRDSKYLLDSGFNLVCAVEKNPIIIKYKTQIQDARLLVFQRKFDEFEFTPNTFDLVTAQWSLPFEKPDNFDALIANIQLALKPQGVFTGQFFGVNASWNRKDTELTFVTRERAESLLEPLHIIKLTEREFDGSTASGEDKHWHFYNFIARKH